MFFIFYTGAKRVCHPLMASCVYVILFHHCFYWTNFLFKPMIPRKKQRLIARSMIPYNMGEFNNISRDNMNFLQRGDVIIEVKLFQFYTCTCELAEILVGNE
jgi:hypothetical protein